MDLSKLVDEVPELVEPIGGVECKFSELRIAALARLQGWLLRHVPHPLDAIKGRLEGFPPDIASSLAEAARKDAASWPPEIGTSAGAVVLMSSTAGQVEALLEGLLVHQPDATRDDAARLYRALVRDARKDPGKVRRIYGAIFGTAAEADEDEDGLPKGRAPAEAAGSRGNGSPARPSPASR